MTPVGVFDFFWHQLLLPRRRSDEVHCIILLPGPESSSEGRIISQKKVTAS